jgi:hypothetical protein
VENCRKRDTSAECLLAPASAKLDSGASTIPGLRILSLI